MTCTAWQAHKLQKTAEIHYLHHSRQPLNSVVAAPLQWLVKYLILLHKPLNL